MDGTMNMLVTTSIIPPNAGIAIGIIISAPFPVEVKIGISAKIYHQYLVELWTNKEHITKNRIEIIMILFIKIFYYYFN